MDAQGHILVPLDQTPLAEAILPYAVAIARAMSQNITLLDILRPELVPLPIGWPAGTAIGASLETALETKRQARAYLSEIAQRMIEDGLNVRTEMLPDEDVVSAIVTRAQQDPSVALIAMSTHGRSGLARLIFGSVAESVLHATPVPLLLYRANEEQAPGAKTVKYKKILVPIDGSRFAEQALGWARQVATATSASLMLCEVVPAVDDQGLAEGGLEPYWMLSEAKAEADRMIFYLEKTASALIKEGFQVETITRPGQPADEILRLADTAQVDLIVMATHGRSGLSRLLLGSVATKVVHGAHVPVLLIRAEEPAQS